MADDADLLRRVAALEERVRQLESSGREALDPVHSQGVSPPESTPQPHESPPDEAPPAASPAVAYTQAPAQQNPPVSRPPRNWEALIGGSVMNRIGIAAVLVGSAYFLRHAFEHEWIGPGMRVTIGMIIGIVLLGWAERLRRKGAVIFAHSVDVISVGVLYLSIWSAAQLYELVPGGVAFAAMTAVTATTVALALKHDSEFLAALAMTAGFLTPVLLAIVDSRAVELFSYVLLLDVAALILLALRPWVRLFIVNFGGSFLLYAGWYVTTYSQARFSVALAFATAFFVVFASVPLVRRWSSIPQLQLAILLLLPLGNAFVFFGELSFLLEDRRSMLVTFTAAIGLAFVAVFALLLHRSRKEEPPSLKSLADLHLGMGLGFLLLTIPLYLEGTAVTVAWLVAAAALFLVHRRMQHQVLATAASVTLVVAVLRLLFVDHFDTRMVLLNLRSFSFGLAIGLLAWIAHSARGRGDRALRNLVTLAANTLAIVALTHEAGDLFAAQTITRDFAWSAIWMLYAVGMMITGFRKSDSFVRWLALGLLGFTVLKVFLYDLAELEAIYRIMSFIALGIILLAISFAYQRMWLEPGK